MLRPACVAEKTPGALELGLRRLDEVGGAADHRRRERLQRLHHLAAGVARGDVLAGGEHRQRLAPALARLAGAGRARAPARAPGRPPPRRRRRSSHSRCSSAPRSRTTAMCSRTASGTTNFASGIQAQRLLRRAHLGLAERRAVRLGGVDRVRRRDRRCGCGGRSATAAPPRPCAAARAPRSASRSSESSTCWTCQPYASKRLPLSSVVNESDVVPSIVMWLSS